MAKFLASHRTKLLVALYAIAMAQLSLPAFAAELSARILPCNGPCAAMQWAQLQIESSERNTPVAVVPTSMNKVLNVYENSSGNIVVVGSLDDKMGVVSVVSKTRSQRLEEFWTTNVAVSPDGRFISFTEMVAPHGQESLYSDKMVYVLDAARSDIEPVGFVNLPKDAVAVFPTSLVREGRRYVMHIVDTKLSSVISTDFKWIAPTRFEFIASTGNHSLVPVTIDAGPGGDWQNAKTTVGENLTCDISQLRRDMNSLLAGCVK